MRVISQLIAGETRVVDINLNSYPTINIQKMWKTKGFPARNMIYIHGFVPHLCLVMGGYNAMLWGYHGDMGVNRI